MEYEGGEERKDSSLEIGGRRGEKRKIVLMRLVEYEGGDERKDSPFEIGGL